MKNICKFLGIIAAVAVIGFVTSCGEPDPEDRVEITITGMSMANGNFAILQLYKPGDDPSVKGSVARSSGAVKISGEAMGEMVYNGKNFADAGSYVIRLEVYNNETDLRDLNRLYNGFSRANQPIAKGPNGFPATIFTPTIEASYFPAPAQDTKPPVKTNFGVYTGKGFQDNVTETIELLEKSFFVSDNSQAADATKDTLTFRIDKWEEIATKDLPSEATSGGYTGGYKFTGKIIGATAGPQPSGNLGYIGSNATAPGFTMADVKENGSGPDCWMFIYFKGEIGSITFIRTPFSKTGNVNEGLVKTPPNTGTVRVYTKS